MIEATEYEEHTYLVLFDELAPSKYIHKINLFRETDGWAQLQKAKWIGIISNQFDIPESRIKSKIIKSINNVSATEKG